MTELSKIELDKLLDAIEVWEQYEQTILQTHDYMRTQYKDAEKLKEFDDAAAEKRRELERESIAKRDMAIILKYKLVRMKESIDAQRFIDELTKGDKGDDIMQQM
jgi:hypothetical protein